MYNIVIRLMAEHRPILVLMSPPTPLRAQTPTKPDETKIIEIILNNTEVAIHIKKINL